MVENPVHGNRYWSCARSIESEGYMDYKPVKPWLGILQIVERPGGTVMHLYHFNRETSQIDEDSNATAIVKPHDLFPNEGQATIHYRQICLTYADRLFEDAQYYYRKAFGEPLKAYEP